MSFIYISNEKKNNLTKYHKMKRNIITWKGIKGELKKFLYITLISFKISLFLARLQNVTFTKKVPIHHTN